MSSPRPGASPADSPSLVNEEVEAPAETNIVQQSLLPQDDEDEEDAGPSIAKRQPRKHVDDDEEAKDDEDDDDDLFGGSGGDEEDDDEEEAIKRPSKSRRQRASSTQSPAPPARRSASDGYASEDEEERLHRQALELRETSTEPAMGYREGAMEKEEEEVQEASFALPSLPVRRGLAHFFARLPNLLQYRAEEFDEATFDAELEDNALQNREGIRIDDAGLRSLLTTNNTIRWRYNTDAAGSAERKPQSNARIVRWSDGSASLQLGAEFYDITTAAERVQTATSATAAAVKSANEASSNGRTTQTPLVPPQPVQHLTHLFVKHDGQDELNVYQAETPIAASMTFRPTSIASESHQRLAKAVRQQRGALVKETVTRQDPEAEKERLEREEKKRNQTRARELRKRKPQDDDEDDAFWASAGRAVLRGGVGVRGKGAANGVSLSTDALDDDGTAGAGGARSARSTYAYDDEDDDEDDGFVVDDDDDEDDDDGTGRTGKEDGSRGSRGARKRDANMDVDDEPDEIDRMEAEMEKQEARRLANKVGTSSSSGVRDAISGSSAVLAAAEEDAASGVRRRRIVESDDDDDDE